MTSIARTPNHDEGISAQDTVTGKQLYLTGSNNASGQFSLNVNGTGGGGGGGTQYVEGATTAPATGTVAFGRYSSSAPTLTSGQLEGLQLDSSGNLKVTGSLSVGGTTDEATFTAGSSTFNASGGVFNDSIANLTSGQQGAERLTAARAVHSNLRDSSGTEIGTSSTPLQVSLANTAANATAVKVDGSAVTQPVSAASLPLPTGAATASNQTGGGQKTQVVDGSGNVIGSTSNALNVHLDSGITVLSGNFTDASDHNEDDPHTSGDIGSFALAVRNDNLGTTFTSTNGDYSPIAVDSKGVLRVDPSGTTSQPISATSLPLPTGAATAAKQPALGTAGTASSDVLTVQGIASMTALKVDGSAVTQPVSGTVTANAGTGTFNIQSNASVNLAQLAGNTISSGVGTSGTGTLRTVVANDTGRSLQSASGSASSSGNNTLVAAGTNRLKVFAFTLSTTSTTAVTCKFQSGASGTDLWSVVLQAPTGVSTGANLVVQPPAWLFATGTATLLNLNLSSANAVQWSVSYWDEA